MAIRVTDEMLAEQLEKAMRRNGYLREALKLLVADVRSIGEPPPQLFVALAKADEALAMCGVKEESDV